MEDAIEGELEQQLDRELRTELYTKQRSNWPLGKHVLAQFTDDAVLVYQAYNSEIGKYALEHKKFQGCSTFNTERMTWIKTSFLWMMYRSGWGKKSNQSTILGKSN
jgi:hypothetical protein